MPRRSPRLRRSKLAFEKLEDRLPLSAASAASLGSMLDATPHGALRAKLGTDLTALFSQFSGNPLYPVTTDSLLIADGAVAVRAITSGDLDILRRDLEPLGFTEAASSRGALSGEIPITALDDLAQVQSLRFATPVYRPFTNAGIVSNQADQSLRSDDARLQFLAGGLPVDGSGVTVGVISDSYDFLAGATTRAADDVASGDLPGIGNPNYPTPVNVLIEGTSLSDIDEGRAMLQLIHDIAPGANLMFASGTRPGGLASAIEALVAAGADIIVDDLSPRDNPMFQDGVDAQAVDAAVAAGVPYFTSGGNVGHDSYESPFRPSDVQLPLYGWAHDFDPGPGVDIFQKITLPVGMRVIILFQWDEPYSSINPRSTGATNNIDILLANSNGTIIAGVQESNLGNDPMEILEYDGGQFGEELNVVITCVSGVNPAAPCGPEDFPQRMKYVIRERLLFPGDNHDITIDEYPGENTSTIFGHHNAAGAAAVTAAFYHYGEDFSPPRAPTLEHFSPRGGLQILFDDDGVRLPVPEDRPQPRFTGPDGGNTTFFGVDMSVLQDPDPNNFFYEPRHLDEPDDPDNWPNFTGTSASAPNVAAVASLMLQANPALTPFEVYDILQTTALDQGPVGFDLDWGHGLVDAVGAVYKAYIPEPPDLIPTYDWGEFDDDNISAASGIVLIGTAPAGSYVKLYDNGVFTGRAVQLAEGVTDYRFSGRFAAGQHAFTVRMGETSAVAEGNLSFASPPLEVTLDHTAPRVLGVTLSGSTSTHAPYAVPDGAHPTLSQLTTVPVGMVDQIKIFFDDAMSQPATADLRLTGAGGFGADYLLAGTPVYNASEQSVTWTVSAPLDIDQIRLLLADAVMDLAGNRLDGEWVNPASVTDPGGDVFPSGNGVKGGAFEFRFTIMPGDAVLDNVIDLDDFAIWTTNDGVILSGARFIDGDFNGDGRVDIADFPFIQNNFLIDFTQWPTSAPLTGSTTTGAEAFRAALPEYFALHPERSPQDDPFWLSFGDEAWWRALLAA